MTATPTPTATVTPTASSTGTPTASGTPTPTASATPTTSSTTTPGGTPPPPTGTPQPEATAVLGCPALPVEECHPSLDGRKATLVLRDRDVDRRDVLQWRWAKGAATTKADFADSVLTVDYELCVYDATLGLVLEAHAGADVTCGGRRPRSCWRESRNGFRYGDRRSPEGLSKIVLRSGTAGRAQVSVQGKGAALHMPALPLVGPIVVQLRNTATDTCWSAVHDRVVKAKPGQLKVVGQ
jgi:hypothetical protein